MSARIAGRIAVALVTGAMLVVAGLHLGSSLPSPRQIGHPDLPWLAIAVVAEAASLLAYALLVRKLLAAGGVAGNTLALLRAAVSGIAMLATLPAGAALSGTYWYRQLRRHGAERGLAALVLGTTAIAGLLSLTGILIVGVGGDAGQLADVRVPIIAIALVLMAVRIALHRSLVKLVHKAFRRFAPAQAPPLNSDTERLSMSRRSPMSTGCSIAPASSPRSPRCTRASLRRACCLPTP
jgi:uncharacterized membrane protein YbhN (UPF0104 family)